MTKKNPSIAIIVSHFNPEVTKKLLQGAKTALKEVKVTDVKVIEVPGALEIPFAAKRLAWTKKYAGIVC